MRVARIPAFLFTLLVQAVAQTAWINEIHYDNSGSDESEFVEIAYKDTTLNGWSLILYNGGNGANYKTFNLGGETSSPSVKFLGLFYSGIQNGGSDGSMGSSPDGLALMDASGNVVEFISYEGYFTATDGPALGMTSSDIGVSESSTTPLNQSLQRTGTGCGAGDFTWTGPLLQTKGSVNAGQGFNCWPTAWINEFHYDNDGADQGEFVEIAFTSSLDLSEYSVILYNGNNGAEYATALVSSATITTDGSTGISLAVLDIPGIQNGSADGIALVDWLGSVVEFISYEGTFIATDGPASGMTSTDIGVSEATTTPLYQSLQRTGSGCVAGDFTWTGPLTQSKGAVNAGQSYGCGSEGPGTTIAPPVPVPTASPLPVLSMTTRDYLGYSLDLVCDTTAGSGFAVRYKYELVGPDLGNAARPSSFYYDDSLPQSCQQISRSGYSHPNCGASGRTTNEYCFDRGHCVMANHMDLDEATIYEANMMTNVLPQATGFNQAGGAWLETENIIECSRDIASVQKQVIFGGMTFDDPSNDYFLTSHGIPTPDVYWKVVVRYYTSGTPEVAAWIFPNKSGSTSDKLDSHYLTTVAAAKAFSGDAMPELPSSYVEVTASWTKPAGCDLSRRRRRKLRSF